MINEGDKAPPFPRLTALKGRTIVLYFYPKDDTTGCTAQACEFRDTHPKFHRNKIIIMGVSPDSMKSHEKFAAKYSLPFELVPDEDHKICEAYGVWQEKSMYGRKYMGVVRTTFIIDETGRIKKIFPKVKPKGHAAEVLAAL